MATYGHIGTVWHKSQWPQSRCRWGFTLLYLPRPSDSHVNARQVIVGDAQCEAGDDLSIEELDALLPCELAAQPGSGQPKIVAYRVDRSTNDHRCLLSGHASEVMHLDDFGKRSVLAR
jgi:hypothetical protein